MYYFNPLVLRVLQTLANDPRVVLRFIVGNWECWYPIEDIGDIKEANKALKRYNIELTEEKITMSLPVSVSSVKGEYGVWILGAYDGKHDEWATYQEA